MEESAIGLKSQGKIDEDMKTVLSATVSHHPMETGNYGLR